MDTKRLTPLAEALTRLRREGEERAAKRLAEELSLPYADAGTLPVALEAITLIPEAAARAAWVAGIQLKARELALAAADPRTPAAEHAIEELQAQHYTVKIFVMSRSGLEQVWRYYAFAPKEEAEITGKVEIGQRLAELAKRLTTFQAVQGEIQKFDFTKLKTTELLETVLAGALGNRASDIHLEAGEAAAKIRFRIDGRLHDAASAIPPRNYASLLTRVKLFSGMKLNIRSEAQDGRFTIALPQKEIEVRVSVIPSEFGETVVMRILDPAAISVELPELGLRPDDLAIVEAELKRPNGLILNTGPTGSGKTTTLYAFLRKLNDPELKIITVEDPIEYRIQGIEQTQVDPEAGYTFASGLRAIVRQDPDVILVGEVRDGETADIALQAALTGHLVLSTLHTNDAVGAVPRLVNLGVKAPTIGAALSLVIAQRLVRKLCEHCRIAAPLSPELAAHAKQFIEKLPARVDRAPYASLTVYGPGPGCDACNHFGYRGRVGIFEFLSGGPQLEQVILEDASEFVLKQLAGKEGMVTMQQDGILKVLRGVTSIAEVEDVTGPLAW